MQEQNIENVEKDQEIQQQQENQDKNEEANNNEQQQQNEDQQNYRSQDTYLRRSTQKKSTNLQYKQEFLNRNKNKNRQRLYEESKKLETIKLRQKTLKEQQKSKFRKQIEEYLNIFKQKVINKINQCFHQCIDKLNKIPVFQAFKQKYKKIEHEAKLLLKLEIEPKEVKNRLRKKELTEVKMRLLDGEYSLNLNKQQDDKLEWTYYYHINDKMNEKTLHKEDADDSEKIKIYKQRIDNFADENKMCQDSIELLKKEKEKLEKEIEQEEITNKFLIQKYYVEKKNIEDLKVERKKLEKVVKEYKKYEQKYNQDDEYMDENEDAQQTNQQ